MSSSEAMDSIFEVVDGRNDVPEDFEGVRFSLPYGSKTFDARFTNHDIDTLLRASKCYVIYDRYLMVNLPTPELPLLASVDRDSVVTDDESAGWDIEMDVVIRPISAAYGKAGRLAVVGVEQDEGYRWSKILYEPHEPLKRLSLY